MDIKEIKEQIIKAGEKAVIQLIKVAKEDIIKYDAEDALAADRLKNAAATKKLAIFDAFEILKRIEEEKELLEGDGIVKNNFPSVSKLLKHFYEPFPAEYIAYKKAKGDRVEMERLLDEWSAAGSYATNMGSRAHFILEKKTIDMYGGYKEVRKPLFECDIEQELRSNSMINAGEKFLKLMDERGAYLLDTEMVLGHPD